MPRSHHHHDIYDDTGRGDERHELERYRVPVTRHRHDRGQERSRAVVDPFHDMDSEMRRFQEETERSMTDWGFGSMFGNHGRGGMLSSLDRMFDDAFASMSNVAENAGDGRGTYVCESRTRTVGPDGRVHEEHVRTTPDEHGNPQTRRTVRDAESEREMDPFWRGLRSPFGQQPYGMIEDPRLDEEVIVEEFDSSDDERHHDGSHRRSSRRYREDVEVQEIDDGHPRPQSSPSGWMRQRYNHWRNRA